MCASEMVVAYFGSSPVGVQVCFSLPTPFDQPFWQKSGKQWAPQPNAGASHSRQMPELQAKIIGGC